LDLIFDTHALVWFAAGSSAFGRRAKQEADRPGSRVFVSAVTAWEYSDLRNRGRLGDAPAIDILQAEMVFELLDFPARLWELATDLPDIHRDPVDRMLVAHAIAADLVIVTADRRIGSYPVRTLW
jgi:PIN domain nuclease of toxin-antitoxin system